METKIGRPAKVRKYIIHNQMHCMYIRVSIKSFPDYKHLLQENYVKYIFFFTIT